MRREFIAALAANFIVAGVVSSLKGTSAGAISFGIGLVLLVVAYLVSKKSLPVASPASAPIHQEVKQEVNPQFNPQFNPQITIGLGPAPIPIGAAPASPLDTKSEPRCNIQFTGVAQSTTLADHALAAYVGRTAVPFATATFENKAIEGQELRIPTVKARLIFRHSDGRTIADISNVAWFPGDIRYATLEANTPHHVVLFFLVREKLLCRSIEQTYV